MSALQATVQLDCKMCAVWQEALARRDQRVSQDKEQQVIYTAGM